MQFLAALVSCLMLSPSAISEDGVAARVTLSASVYDADDSPDALDLIESLPVIPPPSNPLLKGVIETALAEEDPNESDVRQWIFQVRLGETRPSLLTIAHNPVALPQTFTTALLMPVLRC